MRVLQCQLFRYQLPFKVPFHYGNQVLTERQGFILRVTADNGRIGWGEAAPLPGFRTETLEQAGDTLRLLVPAVNSTRDFTNVAAIRSFCDTLVPLDRPASRCALSTALFDAICDREMLARKLEPRSNGTISINATTSGADGQMEEWARDRVRDGFRVLKVKVGLRDWVEERSWLGLLLNRVRAPGLQLRLDANGAWSRDDARRALDSLMGWPIECVEQPVAAHDLEGLIDVARRSPVPVAADEALTATDGAWDALVRKGTVQAVVIKPMVFGGPDIALERARQARLAGVKLIVTTSLDSAVGRRMAMHVAAAIDPSAITAHGLATASFLAEDIAEPDPVAGPRIILEQRPGLGTQIDPSRLIPA